MNIALDETIDAQVKRYPVHRHDFKRVAPIVCENDKFKPTPYLLHTVPYDFTLDDVGGDSVVTIPAGQSSQIYMTNDNSGTLLVSTLTAIYTSIEFTAQIYDAEYQRYMSNRPIHASNLLGSAQYPYELPIDLFVEKTQVIKLDLRDLSIAPNTVRVSFGAMKMYWDYEGEFLQKTTEATKISRPYFYTTDDDVTLPALATTITSANLTIVNDADFYYYTPTIYSDGAFKMKVTNSATGFGWSNGWIHSSLFGGTALHHEKKDPPMIIQRSTQLKFDFMNLSGAPNRVFLCLGGVHYYYAR